MNSDWIWIWFNPSIMIIYIYIYYERFNEKKRKGCTKICQLCWLNDHVWLGHVELSAGHQDTLRLTVPRHRLVIILIWTGNFPPRALLSGRSTLLPRNNLRRSPPPHSQPLASQLTTMFNPILLFKLIDFHLNLSVDNTSFFWKN